MKSIVKIIDKINEQLGKAASWCSLLLVLIVCIDVILRYFFKWSQVWIMEIELYLFAIIFLIGGAYAFQKDQHVRVDVFYSNMSEHNKAIVNLIGGIMFLIPWSLIMIYIGQRYFIKSWNISESSSQPGGLPALYIKKGLLVFAFLLLFLQGVSSVLKSILILQNRNLN